MLDSKQPLTSISSCDPNILRVLEQPRLGCTVRPNAISSISKLARAKTPTRTCRQPLLLIDSSPDIAFDLTGFLSCRLGPTLRRIPQRQPFAIVNAIITGAGSCIIPHGRRFIALVVLLTRRVWILDVARGMLKAWSPRVRTNSLNSQRGCMCRSRLSLKLRPIRRVGVGIRVRRRIWHSSRRSGRGSEVE